MKDAHTLIVPDIHGRTFWKDIKTIEHDKVVFLGDYLDPYPEEWELGENYSLSNLRYDTIENFKEIIEYKKSDPKNITLLLGNHDCGYLFGRGVCDCRVDIENYKYIQELFRDNQELFDLAHRIRLGTETFILSHAGILKGWISTIFDDLATNTIDPIDRLNNALQLSLDSEFPEYSEMKEYLRQIDFWRGGYSDYGSCIWGDLRNILQKDKILYPDGTHIFGHHSSLENWIEDKKHRVVCLDCKRIFGLTKEGKIIDYGND